MVQKNAGEFIKTQTGYDYQDQKERVESQMRRGEQSSQNQMYRIPEGRYKCSRPSLILEGVPQWKFEIPDSCPDKGKNGNHRAGNFRREGGVPLVGRPKQKKTQKNKQV